MISRGEGVAGERKAIFDGWQVTIKGLSDANIDSEHAATMVVCQNYLEMMSRLATDGNTKVVYIPSGPTAATDLMKSLSAALETSTPIGPKTAPAAKA